MVSFTKINGYAFTHIRAAGYLSNVYHFIGPITAGSVTYP